MKKTTLILAVTFAMNCAFAGGNIEHNDDRYQVRFANDSKRLPNSAYQQKLREQSTWTTFLNSAGAWQVIFNEETGLPHRAYGAPVVVSGATPGQKAMSFINTYLADFKLPVNDLVQQNNPLSNEYQHVNYYQLHNNLKILFSRIYVKMTLSGGVVAYGLDVFRDINISTTPILSSSAAIVAAKTGFMEIITGTSINPELFILPVPEYRKNKYHLVYEVIVSTKDGNGIPANYYTLVDANDGKILYRRNTVMHFGPPPPANTDVNVTGTVYTTHPYNASSTQPMVNMRINVNTSNQYTDATGYLGLTNTTPTPATLYLEGLWSSVRTNNVVPSYPVTLNPGVNNLSFNANANIKELSGYYHVNIVHDYMKSWFPTFPSMDNPLTTNIDVSGSCNAYYNGTSINFIAADAQCNCLSQCADVVYHEYGHGISDMFYTWQSANFQNGAMGEGYSDVWGCSLTQNPVLGIGFYTANQNGIRRYDMNPKRYPEDIVGEVHADGEIIAGAWWDVGQLLNINYMNKLFTDTHWALVTGPDGTEGQVYYDILVEALLADDVPSNGGDNNICNGTPNGVQIKQGFANHGITLITNVNLTHNEVLSASSTAPISIPVVVNNSSFICGVAGALLFWRTDDVSAWNQVVMTGTLPNLTGTIPAQAAGTIVRYYVAVTDNQSTVANVLPTGADAVDPNIPYYILVDHTRFVIDDFETFDINNPTWIVGSVNDNATTGIWEFANPPSASYLIWPDPNTIVQPGVQHTTSGSKCFVTENTSVPSAGAGAEDVDGGMTTIESPSFNLTSYTAPAISYWRWYSNDQGATPGTDYWQVLISDDNFATWDTIEYTSVADHNYRRFVIRVTDYITPSATVLLRFIAEDANAGSLIESSIDDLEIWDVVPAGVDDHTSIGSLYGYPNPSSGNYTVSFSLLKNDDIKFEIFNAIGEKVASKDAGNMYAGEHRVSFDTKELSSGIYHLKIHTADGAAYLRFSVAR